MGDERIPFRATEASARWTGVGPLPAAVLLENVRSLYNVGAFFRTADAVGLECLYLAGITGYPPQKMIAKTALGAEETVPWEHAGPPPAGPGPPRPPLRNRRHRNQRPRYRSVRLATPLPRLHPVWTRNRRPHARTSRRSRHPRPHPDARPQTLPQRSHCRGCCSLRILRKYRERCRI